MRFLSLSAASAPRQPTSDRRVGLFIQAVGPYLPWCSTPSMNSTLSLQPHKQAPPRQPFSPSPLIIISTSTAPAQPSVNEASYKAGPLHSTLEQTYSTTAQLSPLQHSDNAAPLAMKPYLTHATLALLLAANLAVSAAIPPPALRDGTSVIVSREMRESSLDIRDPKFWSGTKSESLAHCSSGVVAHS